MVCQPRLRRSPTLLSILALLYFSSLAAAASASLKEFNAGRPYRDSHGHLHYMYTNGDPPARRTPLYNPFFRKAATFPRFRQSRVDHYDPGNYPIQLPGSAFRASHPSAAAAALPYASFANYPSAHPSPAASAFLRPPIFLETRIAPPGITPSLASQIPSTSSSMTVQSTAEDPRLDLSSAWPIDLSVPTEYYVDPSVLI